MFFSRAEGGAVLRRILLVLLVATVVGVVPAGLARERRLLDDTWQFHAGDISHRQRSDFNDSSWLEVDLPHDWSIAGATHPEAPSGGAGGFFPTGVGYYRKVFLAPESWSGHRVLVEFEGVYQNAEIWINGHSLGTHPYGYTPIVHDLTAHLNLGKSNTLLVRVDNSRQPNTRWYSGSGIYRHVWLNVVDPLHIVPWGVFVSTREASKEAASIQVVSTVRNNTQITQQVKVEVEVVGPRGILVASTQTAGRASVGSDLVTTSTIAVPEPRFWAPATPLLYTAITRVVVGDKLRDEVRAAFGIRTVEVSAGRGFELNGQSLNLVGSNLHHDNGPLGAAAFDRAEERKVELLKRAGFNAIRTAHNPPSTSFLDACDRLGVLVIDEAFDGWAKKKTAYDYGNVFREWWQRDLDAMVLRDRNHPAVVMWSIGNEVYERGGAAGTRIAQEMRARIHRLDTTRPITAGINGLGKPEAWPRLDPLFASLDVAGYNYEDARHPKDHARLPARVIALAESYQSKAFECWSAVYGHPYVIGDFVWSGIDYLGEAGIGRVFPPGEEARPHWEGVHYPWHGAACGDIDITGWRKPISHYRNIVWDGGEKLYAAVLEPSPTGEPWNLSKWSLPPARPSWTWPGEEGEPLSVEVYSRHDAVRLYLNDRLLGEKPTGRAEQFKALFEVTYEPGSLRAVSVEGGEETAEFVLTTAGDAARIRLSADRERLRADGQDLAFVTVEAVDTQGHLRPDADPEIRYELDGPAVIAAIGSGDLTSREPYHANPRRLFRGRAIVVIRSSRKPGRITLKAGAEKLEGSQVAVDAE